MDNGNISNPTTLPPVEDAEVFDLAGGDDQLAKALDSARRESEGFWNKDAGFNLEKIRDTNVKLWQGKHWDDTKLYEHEIPYMDNRVFMSTEAVISHVTSEIANPECIPEGDTETSIQLATDVELFLLEDMKDQRLQEKSKIAARFLYLMRFACYKEYFDPKKGDNGEICIEVPDPRRIVVDHRVALGKNPRYIAEYCDATCGELIDRFKSKEKEILQKAGYVRKVKQALDKPMHYWEYWFTQNTDGKETEAVGYSLDGLLMGAMRNPNFNYDGDNFFDLPVKPYIPINYLTFGTHWVDNISAIEQVWYQQAGINRRGFQVSQNADEANGHVVISKKAMTSADAQNITGDPKERIMVDTDDVRTAFGIVGGQLLPQYVVDQIFMMQHNIDDVLGTPAIFRGGDNPNDTTLGENIIVKDQSYGRHDPLVKALDSAHARLYQHHVQMMKVWYTEEHYKKLRGEDGKFTQVAMHANRIEPGLRITVTAGSTLPVDRARKAQVALKLAQLNMIDPLSMFEDLGLQNPNRRLERLIKYQTDPITAAKEAMAAQFNRDAFADVLVLSAGEMPEVRDEVTPEYVAYLRKFMMGGEYRKLVKENPKVQANFMQFLQETIAIMDEQLQLEQTQQPEPQPGDISNPAAQAALGGLPAGAPGDIPNTAPPQPNAVAPVSPGVTTLPAA